MNPVKEPKKYLANYPLEYYQVIFTEERWVEIEKVLNNWENPTLIDGKTFKSLIRNPETGICFNVPEGKENVSAHMWDHYKTSVFREYITEEEFDLCHKTGSSAYTEKRELTRFEKAEKIKEEDYGGGPIFTDDEFHFGGIDDLRDMTDPEDMPLYVYGVEDKQTIEEDDLWNMICSHYENVDLEEVDIPRIPDYLAEAWKRYVKEHSETYYNRDDKVIILIDNKLEDIEDEK